MSKREKIILVAVVLAIAYGGYNFLGPAAKIKTSPAAKGREIKALASIVTQTADNLRQAGLSGAEKHIIALAEAEWAIDPFLHSGAPFGLLVSETEEDGPAGASFIYSGYLKIGSRKMAIIDGLEYKPGEELEAGGYIVRDIFPNKVVIETKAGETAGGVQAADQIVRKIIVPLTE